MLAKLSLTELEGREVPSLTDAVTWLRNQQMNVSNLDGYGGVLIHQSPGYANQDWTDVRWKADPYFAYLAYRSLLLSNEWTSADIASTERLIRWHFRTIATAPSDSPNYPSITNKWYSNTNGTPAELPPGLPLLDAEDSATALAIDLTRQYVRRGGDRTWLLSQGVLEQFERQLQLLDDLTDPADGLSWNFRVRTDPTGGGDLRVKYLADACEVFVGRQAMGWLYANIWNDATKSAQQYAKAEALRIAIQLQLYNPTTGVYRLYKHADGVLGEFDPTQAYPSYLITTPAIYGLIPRGSDIATRQVTTFNNVPAWTNWADDNLSLADGTGTRTALMGFAARISGDPNRANTQQSKLLTTYFPDLPPNQLPAPAYPMIVAEAGWLLLNASYTNLAPTANAVTATTRANTSVSIALSGNDPDVSDQLQYFITTRPQNGTVAWNGSNWIYTPNLGFVGIDSFAYRATDGELDSLPVNASITVNPPGVTSAIVNGGAVQRSKVTSMTVMFNAAVTIASGAFTLTGISPSGVALSSVSVSFTTQVLGGVTVATLSFGGQNTNFGSLADGRWTLLINRTLVTIGGIQMAQDYSSATAGVAIHRLFGDTDGDGDVDAVNNLRFRQAFGRFLGDPLYRAELDFDGDGDIDAVDNLQFRLRFGTTLP
jgi:hypothetical protein